MLKDKIKRQILYTLYNASCSGKYLKNITASKAYNLSKRDKKSSWLKLLKAD